MAIAVVMEFVGATLDQYDEVIKRMHFTPAVPVPRAGCPTW
ncbi:hypothetical protein ACQCSU_11675 [Pseudarthrobacter sp. O4]